MYNKSISLIIQNTHTKSPVDTFKLINTTSSLTPSPTLSHSINNAPRGATTKSPAEPYMNTTIFNTKIWRASDTEAITITNSTIGEMSGVKNN